MRFLQKTWLYLWVSPSSSVGLTAAMIALVRGGRFRVVDGVLEVACEKTTRMIGVFMPISAITLGHVVVGASLDDLNRTRTHERVHVRQYERWGALFIPAYLLASGWAWLRGRHPYLDNPFEVEAYAISDAALGTE